MAEADQVVHFAAESHVDRSINGAADFVRTNVVGTQVLLDAALRYRTPFVHISTDEVYGSIESGSWPETHPLAPNSPYSASKASSDLLALAYHRTHGLDVRVTRCSNNYGPHQFPEKVIPLFVSNLLDGKKVPLYGEGLNVRDWLHVEDHCQGIELVRTRGRVSEVYNIGGGTELSNKELTGPPPRGPAARTGTGSSASRTARATTCATPSTGPRSTTSSGTPRSTTSPRAWPTPSPGTATTGPGGSPSRHGWSAADEVAGHRCRRDARPRCAGGTRPAR